jgi:hypothetical protein
MDEQQEFLKKLLLLQRGKGEEIRKIYYAAILDVSKLAERLPYKSTMFKLALYPLLKKRVDYLLKDMATKIEATIVSGVDQAWQLSDQKNRVFIDKKVAKYGINQKAPKVYYDTNKKALEAFKKREVKGLNLSKRVWKSVKPFKNYVEKNVAIAIAEGEGAKVTASRMNKYLSDPDKALSSVKNTRQPLKLSRRIVNYSPGQGVYKSSYKNVLRLTRTENNIAYRTADYNRWQSQDFVVGIDIKLSAAHPRFDMCDHLAGSYPKDFLWTGWHPQCICYQTPILISTDEMKEVIRAKMQGKTLKVKSKTVSLIGLVSMRKR